MNLVMPDTVASGQDLAAVLTDVRNYSKWAQSEIIKQKVSKKSTGPQPDIAPEATAIIRSWNGGKPLTAASIDSLIKALEDYKKTAPSVTITLAAIPSGDVKLQLVAWCRKELHKNILVSFRLNRNILGGMVVAYGSHIHDWSFRRKLINGETPFSEVLARV